MLTGEQGRALVRLARQSIREILIGGNGGQELQELPGHSPETAYVTLRSYPGMERLADIGGNGGMGIEEAVRDAASLAAQKIGHGNPNSLVLEVSILSTPRRIRAKAPLDYDSLLRRGRDGVLVRYGANSALILPTLSAELNYSGREMLAAACEKAGLPAHMWPSPTLSVFRIEAQVFAEGSPGGKVTAKRVMG